MHPTFEVAACKALMPQRGILLRAQTAIKADTAELLIVQDAKEMVKKAEYNRETKTAEAKVVANAAHNKRNELTDLERMLAR